MVNSLIFAPAQSTTASALPEIGVGSSTGLSHDTVYQTLREAPNIDIIRFRHTPQNYRY